MNLICFRPFGALALASLPALALLTPAAARACGGFFCDVVNNVPVPVDQTGENIVFAIDKAANTVEAHIQIQYTGDPLKFGWVIPVTAVPDFAVGSELFFSNLLASTVPTYTFTSVSDCQDPDRDRVGFGCGGDFLSAGTEDGFEISSAGESDGGGGGLEIVKREIVGAYQIVVLKGGTAQELYDWLTAAGYYQDPDALPIVQKYLDEGYYFAAAKLIHGAGIEELQPIVMTYAGTVPCVPLRLTAIAAMDNMGVRVFALGDTRAVPTNYDHVEINDAMIDWPNQADNYLAVVGEAIDEAEDGHGFVTEYAGPSSAVQRAGLFSAQWNADTFRGADPIVGLGYTVIDALESQGLLQCGLDPFGFGEGDECTFNHPQILPLLRTYLPAAPGYAENYWYTNLEELAAQIDLTAWDSEKFADGIQERIIDPGKRAVDLLNKYPYLTRMLTIISPHEMTVDPEFTTNPDLEDVSQARTAVRNIPCEGSNKMVLPSGIHVLMEPGDVWPTFGKAIWARRIEAMTPSGAPQVLTDNAAEIDAVVRASNKRYEYDDGTGVSCAFRRGSLGGALSLGLILGIAWRGRRRRA